MEQEFDIAWDCENILKVVRVNRCCDIYLKIIGLFWFVKNTKLSTNLRELKFAFYTFIIQVKTLKILSKL